MGTCPDLGTIEPIAPPLRQVARTWSRRIAAGQTIAVVEAGGRTVSLGSILGPEFSASPGLFFGPDQFHPSAAGYASLASVLLPSVLAAAGLLPFEDLLPEAFRGEGVMPISYAAVEAAKTPGTEIDGTEVGGSKRGARGRWCCCATAAASRRPTPRAPVEGAEPGQGLAAVGDEDADPEARDPRRPEPVGSRGVEDSTRPLVAQGPSSLLCVAVRQRGQSFPRRIARSRSISM